MLLFEIGFTEIQGILMVILFGISFYVLIELKKLRGEVNLKRPPSADNSLLQLQAYERLTLFTNRISLKNIVNRMYSTTLSAAELRAGLTESINGEYEHNLTQQNYVSAEIWKAVTNMKDQNKLIINQLASTLPPTATAMDLSKMLLEYADMPNAEMGKIVLDAIQYEVKKLV